VSIKKQKLPKRIRITTVVAASGQPNPDLAFRGQKAGTGPLNALKIERYGINPAEDNSRVESCGCKNASLVPILLLVFESETRIAPHV
jgi:hypothetical protein